LEAFQLKKKKGTNLKKDGMKRNGDYFHNFNTPVLFSYLQNQMNDREIDDFYLQITIFWI